MMFSSKTPRDLNHDPMPYLDAGGWRSSSGHVGVKVYNPRAKFDHVQHNAPNPILTLFRSDLADSGEGVEAFARSWARLLAEKSPNFTLRKGKRVTEHAYKVLTRLAALTKGQA